MAHSLMKTWVSSLSAWRHLWQATVYFYNFFVVNPIISNFLLPVIQVYTATFIRLYYILSTSGLSNLFYHSLKFVFFRECCYANYFWPFMLFTPCVSYIVAGLLCFAGLSPDDAQRLLGADRSSGTMHLCLSRALTSIRIPNWWIVNTGLCMTEFRGIDVYLKLLSPQILDWAGEVPRYVLNTFKPWYSSSYGSL